MASRFMCSEILRSMKNVKRPSRAVIRAAHQKLKELEAQEASETTQQALGGLLR
jgi:hypothetical protein